jgi:hypothetical protein
MIETTKRSMRNDSDAGANETYFQDLSGASVWGGDYDARNSPCPASVFQPARDEAGHREQRDASMTSRHNGCPRYMRSAKTLGLLQHKSVSGPEDPLRLKASFDTARAGFKAAQLGPKNSAKHGTHNSNIWASEGASRWEERPMQFGKSVALKSIRANGQRSIEDCCTGSIHHGRSPVDSLLF